MKGASDTIKNKPLFHQFNHIVPYIKMTTIRGKKIECGSTTANQKGKNEAVITGEPASKYIYPFQNDSCYSIFLSGILDQEPFGEGTMQLEFKEEGGAMSRGFLNSYVGSGHTKEVKLNM